MKIFAVIIGAVILGAAALLFACLRGVATISKDEDRRNAILMEDDRCSCGLIEEE